jgi:hypothetical protein
VKAKREKLFDFGHCFHKKNLTCRQVLSAKCILLLLLLLSSTLAGVKAKREKLFGFGHRVYKNFDPRAKIIRGVAEDVFKIAGRDPLIEIAIALQVGTVRDRL